MRQTSSLLMMVSWTLGAVGWAGEAMVPREEFRQSRGYPYVFRNDSYLAMGGPVALRFAAAGPKCAQRNAPPLIGGAKGPEKPISKSAVAPVVSGEPPVGPAPGVALPVEAGGGREEIDFNRIPSEVLDFFKNTEGRPVSRAYLFDPIFQPAINYALPKSKATYQQK